MKALENFHKYRGDAPFAVWLFRIAHNAYVDYLLRRHREMVFSEGETTLLETPPSGPEEELLRDVVSLRYAGELKFGQIALALGKTASSVRMIHHRALRALRAIYLRDSTLEFVCANV